MPNSSVETQKFAARLELALVTKGFKHSPTVVANKFNEVLTQESNIGRHLPRIVHCTP